MSDNLMVSKSLIKTYGAILLALVLIVFLYADSAAQSTTPTFTISGKIKDESNEPVPYVQIALFTQDKKDPVESFPYLVASKILESYFCSAKYEIPRLT